MNGKSVKVLKPGLLILVMIVASCAGRQNVNPELLTGPGWTRVDNNLHQLEGPPPGPDAQMDFRVYRSGAPDKDTFAKWCDEYKIERVIDMAGTADKTELAYEAEGVCPNIKVVYSVKQDPEKPVSDGFLKFFDSEIERARKDKVGILFRCTTGSHRAGRAAAYFQMKYQGLNADQAIAVMDYNGMIMPLFDPALRPQVRAMQDYIKGEPCSQKKKFCVQMNSSQWMP